MKPKNFLIAPSNASGKKAHTPHTFPAPTFPLIHSACFLWHDVTQRPEIDIFERTTKIDICILRIQFFKFWIWQTRISTQCWIILVQKWSQWESEKHIDLSSASSPMWVIFWNLWGLVRIYELLNFLKWKIWFLRH